MVCTVKISSKKSTATLDCKTVLQQIKVDQIGVYQCKTDYLKYCDSYNKYITSHRTRFPRININSFEKESYYVLYIYDSTLKITPSENCIENIIKNSFYKNIIKIRRPSQPLILDLKRVTKYRYSIPTRCKIMIVAKNYNKIFAVGFTLEFYLFHTKMQLLSHYSKNPRNCNFRNITSYRRIMDLAFEFILENNLTIGKSKILFDSITNKFILKCSLEAEILNNIKETYYQKFNTA